MASNILATGLNAVLDTERARLSWQVFDPNVTGSVSLQLNTVEVWRSTVNDWGTASKIAEARNRTIDVNIFAGTNYYYWLRARDNSGSFGPLYPSALNGVSFFAGFISRNTTLINGIVQVSVSAGYLTFALKTPNGGDPTVDNPVIVQFYNPDGTINPVSVTGLKSVTFAPGSNFGLPILPATPVPARLYCVAILTNGVVYLGALNTLYETGTYRFTTTPFNDRYIYSGFEMDYSPVSGGIIMHDNSGAGPNSPYRLLSFHDWTAAAQPVPGTWNALPASNTLCGPGVPLPGDQIQRATHRDTRTQLLPFNSGGTGGAKKNTPLDATQPIDGEYWVAGDIALSALAAANYLEMEWEAVVSPSIATGYSLIGWAPGSTKIVEGINGRANVTANEQFLIKAVNTRRVVTVGFETWLVAGMMTAAGNLTINPIGDTYFNSTAQYSFSITERMG